MNILAQYIQTIQITDLLTMLVFVVGVGLLIVWQVREPLLSALDRCPVRRNRLPLFFPFLQLFVWVAAMWLLGEILKKTLASRPESTMQFAQNLVVAALEVVMSAFFVLTARFAFVRGLKGFGLRFRTIGKDIFWAAVNLVAAYPAILLLLWLTIQAGRLFVGPDFELQKHQTLVELQNAATAIKIFLIIATLFIVPVFEELLFRGLLQSTLTAYLARPWASIALTSMAFAAMHPGTHFFGIFALSCCLGYAYEKSGSILRPIFIHVLFNSASVLAALLFEVT
ncbi:MAG: CPBP family intramembrane metalloprotease [Planctomycetes bacterium]|nr:CPBP family intramembrane metalloprotease [Planctomycetota bacterium]